MEKKSYRRTCRRCGEDDTPLYAHAETVCCFAAGCVCCAYRLVVQPPPKSMPNKRPGECLRAARRGTAQPGAASHSTAAGLYVAGQRIATLGDGDLSFSLSLARSGLGSKLVATTYLTRLQLHMSYGQSAVEATLRELGALGATVRHGIDASDASALLALAADVGRFDRVVWNFPCVAASPGADGQLEQIDDNKKLVRSFFRGVAAEGVLAPGGEVHVSHKMKPPFGHWGVQALAGDALRFRGGVIFDRALHPGYTTRKVAGTKSFPTWDAQVLLWSRLLPSGGGGGDVAAVSRRSTVGSGDEAVDLASAPLTVALRASRVAAEQARAKKRKRRGAQCELTEEAPVRLPSVARSTGACCRLIRVTDALLDRVCASLTLHGGSVAARSRVVRRPPPPQQRAARAAPGPSGPPPTKRQNTKIVF